MFPSLYLYQTYANGNSTWCSKIYWSLWHYLNRNSDELLTHHLTEDFEIWYQKSVFQHCISERVWNFFCVIATVNFLKHICDVKLWILSTCHNTTPKMRSTKMSTYIEICMKILQNALPLQYGYYQNGKDLCSNLWAIHLLHGYFSTVFLVALIETY